MAKFLDQSGLTYFINKLKAKFVTQSDYGLPIYYVETGDVPSGGTYQTKTVTPSTSQQIVTPDTGYDALESVTVGAMPAGTEGTPTATKGSVSNHAVSVTPSVVNAAGYITGGTKTGSAVSVSASELVSGTLNISENGTADVTNYASVNVDVPSSGGLNWQIDNGNARIGNTAYTDTGLSITVAKTGTYDVYWSGFRNTTSGTSGSQLYVNGTARGSAQTTFQNSYVQTPKLTGISLNAGDVVTLRARSRASNYYMCVGNLIIEQTS